MSATPKPPLMPQIAEYEAAEQPVDYKHYLFLLKRNLNLIITFLIMGATLASIYVSRIPDQYQATAQILLEKPRATMQGPQPFLLPDFWQEDYFNTQREIMLGATVLGQVVDEMKLLEYFKTEDMNQAVLQTRGYLNVEKVRGSRLFNITTTSSDPNFSMTLSNATGRAYIKKNFEDLLYFSKEILAWIPQEGKETITVEDPFGKVRQLTREELLRTLPSIQTDSTIRALEGKKASLEAEMTTLLKQYREKHPLVVKAYSQLNFLEQSIQAERQRVIETLKQQAAGKLQVSNARIIEEARLPTKPSGPRRLRTVISFIGAEFLALFVLILAWDYFDETVHSPEDFTRRGIMMAFLGPVPLVKPVDAPAEERFLITHFHPRSPTAESFRYLRVAINFSAPTDTLKNLTVTSSLPNEGKSFVAHNLAISLAQDGNRTLLIDADLRKPVAHRAYKMEKLAGLSNFLTSNIEFNSIVRSTFVENLSVILSGPTSPNPAEILGSQRMVDLLQKARGSFDRVIIDTPPLTGMGDSLVLGNITTHVIFVIRAAKTPADIIRQSKEALEKSGVRIVGAVLNQVDIEKERYGGYYQHYYQSYHRYYSKPKPDEKA